MKTIFKIGKNKFINMKKIILLLTVISVIAFQSCKKDEFTNPDRTSRTSDTPISLIIDGTPVIEQTEQPLVGWKYT